MVVGAGRRRRHDHGQLRHAGRLGGADGHQQRRRVRRRPAGDHHADAPQRPVAQPQLVQPGNGHHGVAMQQAGLKRHHVHADATNRFQKGGVGGGVGQGHFRSGYTQRLGVEADSVELFGVMEQGGGPAGAHVLTNALHDAHRRQRFAEDFFGQLPAARRHDVPLGAEFGAQGRQPGGGVVACTVDPPQFERGHRSPRVAAMHPPPRRQKGRPARTWDC